MPESPLSYADAEAYLLALPRFAEQGVTAMKPGLERMEALLSAMGRPHEAFESVHVGGTNGKGSAASMIAAVGTAGGLRVGLHTSPHLHTLRERMRLDGQPAPEAWVADAVARYRAAFERVGPSFFEATVALSLLYFAEERVDLAVVEVGLGGRLDATNVLTPRIAVITNVARDHAELLGETLPEIAREKAGIAKPGIPLLTAAEGDDVLNALRTEATRRGAEVVRAQDEVRLTVVASGPDGLTIDLTTPVRRYEGLRVELAGEHQAWNAALAVLAAERVAEAAERGEQAVRWGLANVRKHAGLAARCEVLQRVPTVLADVAHNADGLAAALAFARSLTDGRLFVLLGAMRDKEPLALAGRLAAAQATVLPVGLGVPRALPPAAWHRLLEAQHIPTIAPPDIAAGLAWFLREAAATDTLLVTGSHLTAAAARDLLLSSGDAPIRPR